MAVQDISGFGFSPDLVWIKCRSDAAGNRLTDTVRGATKTLESNGTDAENTQTAGLTAFEPDGFRLGDWNNVNGSSRTFVAWGWDMGNTTATNTSGSISSQVRANPTYGQSIVTYTGTGSNATIGHGLSSTPEVVIVKDRSNANSWQVFHTSLGNTAAAFLDLTAAADTGETSYWNNTSPTNSLVTLGTNTKVNHSGHTYVAYAFHSVSGYSKFGSYTGNASTTGPSVTLGFRPAFLMVKKSSDTGSWLMVDATRNPLGLTTLRINADSSNAEDSSADNNVEFTDTGFQIKTSSGGWNASGQSFIYMAFAGGMDSISDYNTDGSIDSRVKANTTYGQSIVSYEGNFTAGATVGHGLSSAPEMIIIKNRESVKDWIVYHQGIDASAPQNYRITLNATTAREDETNNGWNDTAPTSSVFSLGAGTRLNESGKDHIAYCFHSVTGYSKFGSYTGNGSASGPTITLGFRPAFLMVKNSSNGGSWEIYDSTRNPTNPIDLTLIADGSNADITIGSGGRFNFTDTGFTIIHDGGSVNGNGQTMIYMAFADKREYAYWLDQSGNNNDWTSNNLTESDISVDSPTNNFCTWNPLDKSSSQTLSEGNLVSDSTVNDAWKGVRGTFGISSGKWYWEYLKTNTYLHSTVGIAIADAELDVSTALSGITDWWMYSSYNGAKNWKWL